MEQDIIIKIQDIKELLQRINELGQKQFEEFKKRINKATVPFQNCNGDWFYVNGIYLPQPLAKARLKSDSETFFCIMIKRFWEFHKLAYRDIENPIIIFSMRPLLELCYGKIFRFGLQDKKTQRDMTVKSWLCVAGVILNSDKKDRKWLSDYDNLVKELVNSQDKKMFEDLKKNGFPPEKFVRILREIFPLINRKGVTKNIEPYLESIAGISFIDDYLKKIYFWFSAYMHAYIFLLQSIENEKDTKSFMPRCVSVSLFTGYHLLTFVDKNILNKNTDFIGLKQEIEKIISIFKKVHKGQKRIVFK